MLIFFIEKQRAVSQRRRKVEDFVKLAHGEPGSATQLMYVNLIFATSLATCLKLSKSLMFGAS